MPIPTYTYTSADGYTRTRCAVHIARTGPYRCRSLRGEQIDEHVDGKPRCYQCTLLGVDTANTEQGNDHV